jgi:acyl CoA:acetate/3-ketoacid CoA transferase
VDTVVNEPEWLARIKERMTNAVSLVAGKILPAGLVAEVRKSFKKHGDPKQAANDLQIAIARWLPNDRDEIQLFIQVSELTNWQKVAKDLQII